jgi:hypothetical protein
MLAKESDVIPAQGHVDKDEKHGIPGDRYISLSLRATVGSVAISC